MAKGDTTAQSRYSKRPRSRKGTGASNDNFLDVARQLRQTLEETPDEFLRVASRLGVEKRKAYYLVEIDRNLDGLKIDRQRLQRIGWTKLQIIGDHINDQNADDLLTQAEEHTAHELTRLMKREPVDAEPREHVVLLYLTKSEYDVFRSVVTAHGAVASGSGISGKEQALTAALRKLQK